MLSWTGHAGKVQRNRMAHLDGATSNILFQTLAEWNTYLEHVPARDRAGPPCP